MKQFIMLLFLFSITASYGQTTTTDSIVKVIYANKANKAQEPAWFLNGRFLYNLPATTLDPSLIDSIHIIKDNIEIDGITYHGQVYIRTKNAYQPKLISLSALKEKYTDLKNKAVVFTIDGNIVHADYDKYLVDENYLLQIVVDNIRNPKENIDLDLINILTKSEANIKKSKEIRLRGSQVAMYQ